MVVVFGSEVHVYSNVKGTPTRGSLQRSRELCRIISAHPIAGMHSQTWETVNKEPRKIEVKNQRKGIATWRPPGTRGLRSLRV